MSKPSDKKDIPGNDEYLIEQLEVDYEFFDSKK